MQGMPLLQTGIAEDSPTAFRIPSYTPLRSPVAGSAYAGGQPSPPGMAPQQPVAISGTSYHFEARDRPLMSLVQPDAGADVASSGNETSDAGAFK